jgi:hypothetical protein
MDRVNSDWVVLTAAEHYSRADTSGGNGVAQPQDRHAPTLTQTASRALIDRLPHINNATAARLIF